MTTTGVGDRISEYVLDAVVGAGSFGQVWKAHHHIWTDQLVAIKIPTDSQYVRNLQREGITIHGLSHPNIVRAVGLDPYADNPYLVMEFIDGPSLREPIEVHPKGLPIRAAHRIICGLLRALGYSHEHGVIHRDIKPANILIAGGREKPADDVEIADVKVTDFGLGRAGEITTSSIMQSGSLLSEDGKSISGTLAYMAPEQRDGGQTDALSDLYAVGIVLFEMMVGERPSGSDKPSQVRDGLPSWVDPVFSKLYTRRERRFTSAAEVLEAIDTLSVRPRLTGASDTQPPGPAVVRGHDMIIDLGGGVTMELVRIEPGSFQMGSPPSEEGRYGNEGPQHQVRIGEAFYLGKTEVTNAQFRRFRPDHDSGEYKGLSLNGDAQPVCEVSWEDATAFCVWLRRKSGKPFRLPSAAEWEYACRAGTKTRYSWGDDESSANRYCNGNDSVTKRKFDLFWHAFPNDDGYRFSADVGSFSPNAWGLYDMHGNVWEWCEDVYHDNYNGAPDDGTAWTRGGDQDRRVVRGGGWLYNPGLCRSAYRGRGAPGFRGIDVGFRVVSGTP